MRVRDINTNEEFDAIQIDEDEVFIDTKDPDGPVNAVKGTWIITHDDNTISLCHPSVFGNQFEEVTD